MSLESIKRDVLRPVKNNGRRRRLRKAMDKMTTEYGRVAPSQRLSADYEAARSEHGYIPNRKARRHA